MPSDFEMQNQFDLPNHFEQILRNGSHVVAEATRPRSTDAIRARGDQRRRRQIIGSAATVVAIVVASSVGLTHLAAAGRSTPAPITSHHRVSNHHRATNHARVFPRTRTVKLPDVVGLTAPAAESILASLGFQVTIVEASCAAGLPAGAVCSSAPAAGTVSPAGAVVVIGVQAQRR